MPCDDIYLPDPSKFNVTITSQADIDNGALRHSNNSSDINHILVHGAKGTLNFTNLVAFSVMNISCNNELQKIVFPDLISFFGLGIYEAPLLREIDMKESSSSSYGFRIHKTPKLGQGPERQMFHDRNLTALDLRDAGYLDFLDLTSVKSLAVVDTNVSFPKLETVQGLDVAYPNKGYSHFPALKNANNLRFGNGSYSDWLGATSMLGYNQYSPDLVVSHSVAIQPWRAVWDPNWGEDYKNMPVNNVPSVLRLTQLARVDGDLNITNNNGIRKLSIDRLTSVKRLHIMDNPDSRVPGDFSSLTTANSIYINGIIDNTTSPALFPGLSSAGEVTIEAWNPDFDCSRLMHMYETGTIRYLSCNGTNGTDAGSKSGNNTSDETNNPTTASTSPGGLTTATSAGIGAGVGAVVLGIIVILVWSITQYRRKLRGLKEESHNNGRDDPKEATREAPPPRENLLNGTQIEESGGRSMPHQSGGTEIMEAGGRALRAEAGDGRGADGAVVAQEKKSPPLELP